MTTTARLFAARLWAQALYTMPPVAPAQVEPGTRWLILSRASVVIGRLLALRGTLSRTRVSGQPSHLPSPPARA